MRVLIGFILLLTRGSALGLSTINTREVAKLFGRFADKELLLDVPGAGTPEMMNCCHGGCDNCAYSHIFDFMSSARAKWIPLYIHRRLIDGREHTAPWAPLFSPDNETITKAQFSSRLQTLPLQLTMGPPQSVPADEDIDPLVIDKLWEALAENNDTLTPTQVLILSAL